MFLNLGWAQVTYQPDQPAQVAALTSSNRKHSERSTTPKNQQHENVVKNVKSQLVSGSANELTQVELCCLGSAW